jgi:hypothetical protein
MNQQQSPETEFARRLRAALTAIVAERGAAQVAQVATSATAARPAWRRRGPRLGLAVTAVAAIAAAMLIVNAGDGNTPAAFAVDAQPEGMVNVEIRSLEDAEGLEQALDEDGVPASVNYLPAGKACREPRFRTVLSPERARTIIQGKKNGDGPNGGAPYGPSGPLTFSISRDGVGPNQTLVITASASAEGQGFDSGTQVKVAEGTVVPCEPVPAPR